MNKQIEQKLSSREVAEMMEMGHPELLRKIEGITEDFRERNIAFSKYWIESTYKVEGNSRRYKEFLITKRGCEFLAHKTTGTKGNLFTDRYMDRFAEMEQQLINPALNNLDETVLGNMNLIAQNMQFMSKAMTGIQQYVQDSIQAKDNQIDKAMELIGLRAKNVARLTGKLKEVLIKKYGRPINASDIRYINAKNKIFREFKVYKWEEIPVGEYNAVFAYIEECL